MASRDMLDFPNFREHIDIRYGCGWTILSIFFFQCLNRFVGYFGMPKSVVISESKWRNLLISWIHSLISGVWDLSCFYLYPDMFEDLLSYSNYYMYGLLSFSTGYFIYDLMDNFVNKRDDLQWSILLHHFAVLSVFIPHLLIFGYVACSCVSLLMEVSTIFLHGRKLLQIVRIGFNHWFYRLTVIVNLGTFAVFRGLASGGVMYGMYLWYDRFELTYFLCLSGCMASMNVINLIHFWHLLKVDLLRTSQIANKHYK